MARWAARSAVVVATALVGVAGGAAPPALGWPGPVRYVDPVNGWSISYPNGWLVDGSNPANVAIRDPQNQALVGVQVTPTDLPLNAVANQAVANYVVKGRELISLPNGTPAVDIRAEIPPDKRSHQLYVVAGGKAFELNAEAAAAVWPSFSADFDAILKSFAPPASR